MADFPGAGLPAREEGGDLLAAGLRGEVLPVFGDVADEEHRVVEHDEVLLGVVALAGHQLGAGDVEQFDGHAAGVAGAVELRVGVAVGEADHGVPPVARLGEYALAQAGGDIAGDRDFGLHAAVGLGVGVTQHAGVVAVLFDDAHGVFDDGLGELGFARRDFFLGGDGAGEFPGVVEAADAPAEQADGGDGEQQTAEPFAEEEPDSGEQGAHGTGSFGVFFFWRGFRSLARAGVAGWAWCRAFPSP